MRLDFSNARVLAVVAHPDDAELLCAGTLARAKADGAVTGVCSLCLGDKGQPSMPVDNLLEVRAREAREAAEILGAKLFPGECEDGTLVDDPSSRRGLTEVFRQFRPTLVLAHDAGDYHPDHRAASALAAAATWFCASHGQKTASPPLAASPELWWMDCVNAVGFAPDFYIDVSRHVEQKESALSRHQTQLQRADDGDFAPLMQLMRRQMETRGAEAGVAAAEAFRSAKLFKRTAAW